MKGICKVHLNGKDFNGRGSGRSNIAMVEAVAVMLVFQELANDDIGAKGDLSNHAIFC